MTNAIQLRQENQAIEEEISLIKKELENPEEYNIESIKIEDFQLNEDDIPEIQAIKKKIIKGIEFRNNLTIDFNYISNQFNTICKNKKINPAEFANVEKDYHQIQINIENAEKSLFSKLEENKYEISKRKRGKIKNLLKENLNLRISKLKIIEELRTKRDQLTKLQNFTTNRKQNIDHCKDEIEKASYLESEKFIRSKIAASISSNQKLLDLKKDIESIEYLKTIPDEILNSTEFKQLKTQTDAMSANQKIFESAKKANDTDPLFDFLDELSKRKNTLNKNRTKYYIININSLQQQLNYAETKYQVEVDSKDVAIKNLNAISKTLKKFKEEIEKDLKKLEYINAHLKEENSLFKKAESVAKLNQEIGAKNDQYKLTSEEMRNMRFSHQGEINKICYMLNIPIMSMKESPNFVYMRILSEIRELKMADKNKYKTKTLEDSVAFLKQQNDKLSKMVNNNK